MNEPELVNDVTKRLTDHVGATKPSTTPSVREPVPVTTKFIEFALNIIDPDCAWDVDETLEFSDAARGYLSEYPITQWELDGAFALVAQFVHDWVLGEAHDVTAPTSLDVRRTEPLAIPERLPVIGSPTVARNRETSSLLNNASGYAPSVSPTSLETEDPASGMSLRMICGDYEGAPTMALFVGEDEAPILIDRVALQIALEEGWDGAPSADSLARSFRANADGELEVIDLEVDVDFSFE
jgi:hypothetical protein